ncbi:AAA family ATPase [Aureivirga marina]|uniref:AAA family ATPase n=1 Tax=Aureivirga marina TaxID=1182451 RepID=UPI0018C924F9|nr:AAA family ATPase [Aureivirga marina]
MKDNPTPLNQIFFGPPGTGKTYKTITEAIRIIEPSFFKEEKFENDRESLKQRFDHYVSEGNIVFTTFHQSMDYTDFMEGIKPSVDDNGNIIYEVKDGIFKSICNQAKEIKSSEKLNHWEQRKFYKMSLGGKPNPEIHEWCLENNYIALGYGGKNDLSSLLGLDARKTKEKFYELNQDLEDESNYHWKATELFLGMEEGDVVVVSKGNHIIDAIGIVDGDYEYKTDEEIRYFHYRKVKWIAKDLDVSPERFLHKKISQQTIYKLKKESIKFKAFQQLTDSGENVTEKYVLIIDEINRGNVSEIFGELITLIEDDKRLGNSEALKITLPYSKKVFGVPNNLHIIGTMNTADRSVEALDSALRRRFSFKEIAPKSSLLKKKIIVGISLEELLEIINNRIEVLLDSDHKIGHSYFFSVENLEDLKAVFQNKIIPLLQEYFFGDYAKIGLVLGENFVSKKENNHSVFANFEDDEHHYSDKKIYQIAKVDSMNVAEFQNAVESLLNKVLVEN